MRVKLIGPDAGHESTHKVDAATAVALINQLRPGTTKTFVEGVLTHEEHTPRFLTLDDESVQVQFAQVAFYTEGDRFDSVLTLTLETA